LAIITPFPDLEETAPLDDLHEETVPLPILSIPLATMPTMPGASQSPAAGDHSWTPDTAHSGPKQPPPSPPLPLCFRHMPPCHLSLDKRWPKAYEAQALAIQSTLYDVWVWIVPFLSTSASQALASTATRFKLGVAFSPLWLYRPWSPHRRRRWGFGIPCLQRIATHDTVSYHSMIDFIWPFLDHHDRQTTTQVAPAWSFYPRLRRLAATESIAPLLLQQDPPGQPTGLPEKRSVFTFIMGT
jgi:hypothetical protein